MRLAAAVVLAFLLLPAVAVAGPLEDARTAYTNKDSQAITRLVQPLTEQANHGDARAQTMVGLLYTDGFGVNQDVAEAVKWFQKAAEQGEPGAQYNLGRSYASGRGVKKDETEAVKWLQRAADQGVSHARQYLEVLEFRRYGIAKDSGGNPIPDPEHMLYEMEIKQLPDGGPQRQQCVINGSCTMFISLKSSQEPKTLLIGTAWFHLNQVRFQFLASNGYAYMTDKSNTLSKHLDKLLESDGHATENLSVFLPPVPELDADDHWKDMSFPHKALADLEITIAPVLALLPEAPSVPAGKPDGMVRCYSSSGSRDVIASQELEDLRTKAEQGDPATRKTLVWLYHFGQEGQKDGDTVYPAVEKNLAESARWLQKLADQGDVEAQLHLSEAYYFGEGLQRDYAQAYFWGISAAKWNGRLASKWDGRNAWWWPGGPTKCLTVLALASLIPDKVPDLDKRAEEWRPDVTWYLAEAKTGDPKAQSRLAKIYLIEGKYSEALKWYLRVAAQGKGSVEYNQYGNPQFTGDYRDLAAMYSEGRGVKQDWAEAYFWYSIDVRLQPSQELLGKTFQRDDAAKHLTPKQTAAIDKRVAEWKPIPETPPAPSKAETK